LHPGDSADWYRVAVPQGHALEVEYDGTGGVALFVEGADGEFHGDSLAPSPSGSAHVVAGANGSALLVGAVDYYLDGASASYSIQVRDLGLAPDLRLGNLVVSARPLSVGQVPGGRDVSIDVSNVGFAPAASTLTITAWAGTVGKRTIMDLPLLLAPGEARTLHAVWDTTGEIGEANLVVEAPVVADMRPDDNTERTTSTILVGAPGLGVDIGNPGVYCALAVYEMACAMLVAHDGALEAEAWGGVWAPGPAYLGSWFTIQAGADMLSDPPSPIACARAGLLPGEQPCALG
jgi:hypothetical protein